MAYRKEWIYLNVMRVRGARRWRLGRRPQQRQHQPAGIEMAVRWIVKTMCYLALFP